MKRKASVLLISLFLLFSLFQLGLAEQREAEPGGTVIIFHYDTAVVKVTGKEPDSFMEIRGQSVTYGVTLVKDAPSADAAVLFLEYLLDPEGGLAVLDSMGQPPFVPARVPTEGMKGMLPQSLKSLVEVKK